MTTNGIKIVLGAQEGGAFPSLPLVPEAPEGLVRRWEMCAPAPEFRPRSAGRAPKAGSLSCHRVIRLFGRSPARPQEADTASGLILQAICFKVHNLKGYMSVPHLP